MTSLDVVGTQSPPWAASEIILCGAVLCRCQLGFQQRLKVFCFVPFSTLAVNSIEHYECVEPQNQGLRYPL